MKVRVVDVDVHIHVLYHLKEELAWVADQQLRVISTIMLFKVNYSTLRGWIKGTKCALFSIKCKGAVWKQVDIF